jgi:hypothetical protein
MNNLFTKDLETISRFIGKRELSSLKFLLLQQNRFPATEEGGDAIIAMLEKHPTLQIGVTGCPLATIESTTALFDKLGLEQAKRLIFIGQEHLAARHWTAVLKTNKLLYNEAVFETIDASHRQFYLAFRGIIRI